MNGILSDGDFTESVQRWALVLFVFKKVPYSHHSCLISSCFLVETSVHWHPALIPYTKEGALTQAALPRTRDCPSAVTSRDVAELCVGPFGSQDPVEGFGASNPAWQSAHRRLSPRLSLGCVHPATEMCAFVHVDVPHI